MPGKRVVVVVEDAPDVKALLHDVLVDLVRAEVILQDRTAGTFDVVRERRPRLVMLDTEMPGQQTLLQQLKEDRVTRAIPVLGMITRGLATPRDVAEHGYDVVADVMQFGELIEMAREYLERRRPDVTRG